ncbi:hypothetical protein LOAG_13344 [Loa loa]|uniref:Uncharacterized protein n=1 Tax=Loa loa TaxID=7209 RepID=A0A1S0TJN7_LOALO|nr:hypothetical protein LOAG_13344 [Loa loa]EFO15169.1 hypothetical protein LOAG_13344 [Loa loa]
MSMTQIIWFNLLLCVTLAYNETSSLLNPDKDVITTYVHYPRHEQNVAPKNYNINREIPGVIQVNCDVIRLFYGIDIFMRSFPKKQSRKRPHAACDATIENRGEYRKRKQTLDDDDRTTQYSHHTSDIVLCQKTYNDLETLFGHNGDVTYNSESEKITENDWEQVTITTSDDQSQEVTECFAYNIKWENTDRELLGITVDKDLFPGLICNLSPFNSDTSTHNSVYWYLLDILLENYRE